MADEQTELEKTQEAAEIAASSQSYKLGQQSQTRAPYGELTNRADTLSRRTRRAAGRKPMFVAVDLSGAGS